MLFIPEYLMSTSYTRVASCYSDQSKFSTNTGNLFLRNIHNESYVAVYEKVKYHSLSFSRCISLSFPVFLFLSHPQSLSLSVCLSLSLSDYVKSKIFLSVCSFWCLLALAFWNIPLENDDLAQSLSVNTVCKVNWYRGFDPILN